MSQALENEMDLREYAKQIAQEKMSVQRDLENNCKYEERWREDEALIYLLC